MKKCWIVGVPLLLGVLLGFGGTWSEFAGVQDRFATGSGATGPSPKDLPEPSAPRPVDISGPQVVVVNGAEHDFGVMDSYTTARHTYVLKNAGSGPVRLEKGETSCKCALSNLDQGQLLPGNTAEVLLEWTPTKNEPQFRQTADIIVTDQENQTQVVRLQIHGRVVHAVRAEPQDVALSDISSRQSTTAQLRIYAYHQDDLEILDYELTNPDNAEYFGLQVEPLSEAQRQEEPGAKAGKLLTLTVKSGLPLGAINQTIRLKTNVSKSPVLEIPVRGSVISDITILGGRNFLRDRNILLLGSVRGDVGAKANLHLLVKGPHREQVELSLERLDPEDVLQATIGEPRAINQGAVLMYPLTIEIPAGARPVNRLGSDQGPAGRILINTTHPDARQIQLRVGFAVEG